MSMSKFIEYLMKEKNRRRQNIAKNEQKVLSFTFSLYEYSDIDCLWFLYFQFYLIPIPHFVSTDFISISTFCLSHTHPLTFFFTLYPTLSCYCFQIFFRIIPPYATSQKRRISEFLFRNCFLLHTRKGKRKQIEQIVVEYFVFFFFTQFCSVLFLVWRLVRMCVWTNKKKKPETNSK